MYQDAEEEEKHAALKGTFQKAASGKYRKNCFVLSEKNDMRNHMQVTGVRGTKSGRLGLTFKFRLNHHRMNLLKSSVSSARGRLVQAGRAVQTFVVEQINQFADQLPNSSAQNHTPIDRIKDILLVSMMFHIC
jgi:hypothetical protein